MPHILCEKQDAIGVVTLQRPEKRNAFTLEMFRLFTEAFTELEADDAVRAVVVCAAGQDFTTGLDLMDVTPSFMQGTRPFPDTAVDPWDVAGRSRRKPMIVAAHGRCFTLGFELALAADVCVAARDTIFALREVRLGILPLGGGVVRLLEAVGWSTAMRYVLTGDDLSAEEAHRLGLVQELTEPGGQLDRALAIARTIATQPPLAVRAALEHAREALEADRRTALTRVLDRVQVLMNSDDAREAAMALFERRSPVFRGR
jgi:enoyl-CoA hydratase/carnithine racemase